MAYEARIELDSVNLVGDRLTTFVVTYPRFVHSELMTHRVFSRNSSSSRAIPIEKMIQRIKDDPVIPVYWGRNQRGMQARGELTPSEQECAVQHWLDARDEAVRYAEILLEAEVHKQIVNRILEPWMWITVIITATEYNNFFNLRCHPDAQPEIRYIAEMMEYLYIDSIPRPKAEREWHLPFVTREEEEAQFHEWGAPGLLRLSVARCARVSYLTHDGEHDPEKDIKLADQLMKHDPPHFSPLEHQAYALPDRQSANFTGWWQYRQTFHDQNRTVRV